MRPQTLSEVAARTAGGDSFDCCLANFLDEFYAAPSASALAESPVFLAPCAGETGQVQDAYLAATAEELARQFELQPPDWARGAGRHLRRPWFAVTLDSLRAVLLLESPPAFRCRNLFVSGNALSRA